MVSKLEIEAAIIAYDMQRGHVSRYEAIRAALEAAESVRAQERAPMPTVPIRGTAD